jgi:hypothetical protein
MSKVSLAEEFKHLRIHKALYIAEELQSLSPVERVDFRRNPPPLDARHFPVKKPRVAREFESYVRFTQGVPARLWPVGVVPNIRISKREV